MRVAKDLLQLLAIRSNRAILGVLAVEPQYPRRLAELVGLTEHEVSRRLRALERAGLVRGAWQNVGKTVRLYRVATSRFSVELDAKGLRVSGVHATTAPIDVGAVAEAVPRVEGFVGRTQELRRITALLRRHSAVALIGMGGTGKTALAAKLASKKDRPAVWLTASDEESPTRLLYRLADGIRPHAPAPLARQLLQYRDANDSTPLHDLVAAACNRLRVLVVLDRFEAAHPECGRRVAALIAAAPRARFVLTARTAPPGLPRDSYASFLVFGLSGAEATRLLRQLGVRADQVDSLAQRTRGHPLALRLLASGAGKRPHRPLDDDAAVRSFLVEDVLPRLGREGQTLLLVSLIPGTFGVSEAQAVTTDRETPLRLSRLESMGFVTRAGDAYNVHDLVRHYLAPLAPDRGAALLRLGRHLTQTGEASAMIQGLELLVQADRPAEAAALVAAEAAKRAYRFQEQGLADRYRALLERLERAPRLDPPAAAAVQIELAVADSLAGRPEAAAPKLLQARERLGNGSTALHAALGIAEARVARMMDDLATAVTRSEAAVRAASRASSDALRADALLERAFLAEEREPSEPALRLFEAAEGAAARASDARLLGLAQAGAARMMARLGRQEWRAKAEAALHSARAAGDARAEASVYMSLAVEHARARGPVRDLGYTERYLELADQLRDPWIRVCALSDTAVLLNRRGKHAEALRRGRKALTEAKALRSKFYQLAAEVAVAEAQAALGRGAFAARRLRRFLSTGDLSELGDLRGWTSHAWQVLARMEAARGDREGAQDARRWSRAVIAQGVEAPLARPSG